MDEAWERAVESALEGDSTSSPRTLTLDGAVKCLHGRLPPPVLLERFQTLEHLSIANVGVSSLDKFPRLRNLQRLILSDNRIAGGLEFLVDAGLDSLRDLDLSNNRIQSLDDLAPLASLRLVSLDLYECPVTRVRDYRSRVFGMIRTLKYLDKMDADENERPETDDEEEDEEEEEEDEEEDPGSGEIDGDDRSGKLPNGVAGSPRGDDVVDVFEDDESDADEEIEPGRPEANGSGNHNLSNGFRVAAVGEDEEEEDDDVDDEDDEDQDQDPGEEIDAEAADEEDVVQVHAITDSDEEDGDGIEEEDVEEEDDFDGDEGEDEEDVEDEEEREPGSSARLVSTDGEIDEHDQGEEDEDGEIGEEDERVVGEEPGFEEEDVDGDEDEDDDLGGNFLVQQHIPQAEIEAGGDFDACNGEDEDEVDDDNDDVEDDHRRNGPSSSSQPSKRKRGEGDDPDDNDDDDCVEDLRSSKHR